MGFIRYLGLLKSDLVLDVGSGSGPHPRANVLCDKNIKDDTERGGRYLSKTKAGIKFLKNRTLIVGEGERLPFKDKSFDYVICSHVLEHSENPERILQELMRVASRGYIETPTEIYEMLFGWPFHKWYVRLEDNVLVFKRKKIYGNLEGLLIPYFLRDFNFVSFYVQSRDLLSIRYSWNEKINYKIINQDDNLYDDKYLSIFIKKHFENRPHKILSFIKNLPEIMSYFISDNLKYKIFDLIYHREVKKKKFNCRYPVKDGVIYLKMNEGDVLK